MFQVEISLMGMDDLISHAEVVDVYDEDSNDEITAVIMRMADTYSFGPGDKIIISEKL